MGSSEIQKEERGWAGHYICADRCLFRRNTRLFNDKISIIVSSVGLMKDFEDETKFQQIGLNTMVFHSILRTNSDDKRYHDADVKRGEISFESPWMISEINADDRMNKQHDVVVLEIEERILSGEFDG